MIRRPSFGYLLLSLPRLRQVAGSVLVLAVAVTTSRAGEPSAKPAPLAYTDTWVGNSYGQGDGRWIQNNILGMYVADDGTIYTNSWWDEGRRESGIYAGADGTPVGMLESLHDSFGGGYAIAGDEKFIYSSNWNAVRRSKPDGSRAPFPGGAGPHGDSIGVTHRPVGTDKAIGVQGLGVDRASHRMFVSENADDELAVWDTVTMKPIRRWTVPRPGQLAVAPDGTVWIVSRKHGAQPGRVLHFNAEGTKLPQEISDAPGFDPTGICYDRAGGRLLVADNGPAQNFKAYTTLTASRLAPDASLGASIYSGVEGQVTPDKFGSGGLTAIGADAAGNLYVGMNGVGPQSYWHGGGTVLESRTPDGKLRWRRLGLAFVDCADADAATDAGDNVDVYDKYSHYRLDLSQSTAGSEWSYAGRTLNPIRFPADPRFLRAADGWDYTGGTFVRTVQGRKLLFVLSMQARRLLIFRFDPERSGETAIPAGLWESQGGYSAGYPGGPAGVDFFWRDKNGNGTFDADEFVAGPGMPNLGYGMWVDANGDIWSCNHWSQSGVGVRRWRMQGFDDLGNPIYDYSRDHYTEFQRPEGCQGELRRLEYYPQTDTMYVGSTSLQDGDRDAGNRFVKYDHWGTDQRRLAWSLDPPMDKTKISAMSVAGDYLFLGYSFFGTNSREGTIRVYKTSDGSFAGEIVPTPAVGSSSGTFDIPYAIRAYQRKNGEYLVFAEDDHFAKIIVHRWNPTGATRVDPLDNLDRVDARSSSGGWRIDGSNPAQFGNDGGRATRTSDTVQALVWDVPGIGNFAASVYYDAKLPLDDLVTIMGSPDAKAWTPVATARSAAVGSGGGWNVTTFRPAAGRLIAGTRYLKFQVAPSGVSWNIQLGRMELFGGGR